MSRGEEIRDMFEEVVAAYVGNDLLGYFGVSYEEVERFLALGAEAYDENVKG